VQRRQFLASASLGSVSIVVGTHHRSQDLQTPPWQYDGVATIARFGVLTPDFDPVPESELWAMAPRGVSFHAARIPRPPRPAAFVAPPDVDIAVDRLIELGPRAILLGYTSSSYALGAEEEARVHRRLELRANGVPVIFTCAAAAVAFRELAVRRLSLVHPPWFSEETNENGRTYWHAAGFNIVQSVRLQPSRSFSEVAPREVFEFVVAHTPREAEAVFIGGNGMRAVGVIKALETRLRRPVLTANQVLLWDGLRRAESAAPVTQYGSIFDAHRQHR
jgi:maleate isomerase